LKVDSPKSATLTRKLSSTCAHERGDGGGGGGGDAHEQVERLEVQVQDGGVAGVEVHHAAHDVGGKRSGEGGGYVLRGVVEDGEEGEAGEVLGDDAHVVGDEGGADELHDVGVAQLPGGGGVRVGGLVGGGM
jgi:hypothetical protein